MSRLTDDEREAISLAGHLAEVLSRVVSVGPDRVGDLNELVGHIHVIQRSVLAQVACREHPDQYRALGGWLTADGYEAGT